MLYHFLTSTSSRSTDCRLWPVGIDWESTDKRGSVAKTSSYLVSSRGSAISGKRHLAKTVVCMNKTLLYRVLKGDEVYREPSP